MDNPYEPPKASIYSIGIEAQKVNWFFKEFERRMTDVLVFWRDFRKNTAHGDAMRWHSNARVLGDLLPGDRLWLVTSGQALKHEAEQAGFLVAVWQVAQVQPNSDDDSAYPAEDYKYRVTASEVESITFDQPVPVDHILRPSGRDKATSIGRFLQGPRKLTDEKVRLLRAAAGPQMAQQWLTGKRQPTESADNEHTPEGSTK